MIAHGLRHEDRAGHLLIGFYHPDHPGYGFQQVSGRLFDGQADPKRLVHLAARTADEIVLPSIEDMIADRLGQFGVATQSDDSRLRQARLLYRLAERIDKAYLHQRIADEGGDPTLLDTDTGPEVAP